SGELRGDRGGGRNRLSLGGAFRSDAVDGDSGAVRQSGVHQGDREGGPGVRRARQDRRCDGEQRGGGQALEGSRVPGVCLPRGRLAVPERVEARAGGVEGVGVEVRRSTDRRSISERAWRSWHLVMGQGSSLTPPPSPLLSPNSGREEGELERGGWQVTGLR